MTEMLRGVLGNQAQKVVEIVRDLPGTVGTLKDAAAQGAGDGRRCSAATKGAEQPDAGAAHAAERRPSPPAAPSPA